MAAERSGGTVALRQLVGGNPRTAAERRAGLTRRYQGLLEHYGLGSTRISLSKAHVVAMSASLTEQAVRDQLSAMGGNHFDIGILDPAGMIRLLKPWDTRSVIRHLRWFRRENARGAEIFVRPSGPNALTLIDGLDRKN